MSATPAVRYRAAATALRGIRARAGRTAATDHAIARHERDKDTAVADLLTPDPLDSDAHQLVGLLVAEEKLAERIRIARLAGQLRPELAARLNDTRRQLKETS